MPVGTRQNPAQEKDELTMADDKKTEEPAASGRLSTDEMLVKLLDQMKQVRTDITSMSNKLDEAIADAKVNEGKISSLELDVSLMKQDIISLKHDNSALRSNNNELKDRLIKLEAYSRRENLIFYGVEQKKEENCSNVITKVMQDILQVENAADIKFDRCHRLQSKSAPQPLIVRFTCGDDRNKVWKARGKLKGSNSGISISEDFPTEITARRKSLYPIMKRARQLKHVAGLSADRLYIDNVAYTVDNLHLLPHDLDPANIATKKHQNVTAFYSGHSPLSNFHSASFEIKGVTYPHVEQYLQYNKAIYCDKPDVAQKIKSTESPLKCKILGDSLNVKTPEWLAIAKDVTAQACKAKFVQNERARKFLLETGDDILAEATTDNYWGTGLKVDDEKIGAKGNWKGQNVLGDILMQIRDQIRI